MNWITVAAVIAASMSAYYLYETLNAAQDASMHEERAYVTIGRPDGIVADLMWPKDENDKAGIIVYFQNNGRVPAKFNWGSDTTVISTVPRDPKAKWDSWKGPFDFLESDHPFQPMFRGENSTGETWSGTIDVAGGSTYEGVLWNVPKIRMLQLLQHGSLFQPKGIFEYCDGFGNRVAKRFSLAYSADPYDRFFLTDEDDVQRYQLQAFHHDAGYTYIPPCGLTPRKEISITFPNLPKP